MEKISAVYKIVNTVNGDFYVGSSKNVFKRWAEHKCPSKWKENPNSPLYQDMQRYGLDKFRFQILAPVMPEYLTQVEQEFIDMLKPTYNNNRAKGQDIERYKEAQRKATKKYFQSEKGKEVLKEINRKAVKKYYSRLCLYNDETLRLDTLVSRFRKLRIEHPLAEAKKYLLNQ